MPREAILPGAVVTEALELARTRSLVRTEVAWDQVIPEFRKQAEGCATLGEAHDLIRALLLRLGDGHSFLRTRHDMVRARPDHSGMRLHQEAPIVIDLFPEGPAERQGMRVGDRIARVDDESVNRHNWRRLRREALCAGTPLAVEQDGRLVEVELPAGFERPTRLPQAGITAAGVGLIDLPGLDGDGDLGNGQTYGEIVSGSLHELEAAGARAWIIDLRRCDGGNMWPLLSGLAPLLGVCTYGSFVDPVDDVWLDWGFDGRELIVVNRDETKESYVMADLPDYIPLTDQRAPVALLTSAVTSSSGEAVLISFLGRIRTRTFGLATGGLPTSNNLHVLEDGSWLLLAENLEADRTGRIHRGRIEPDEPVEIDWRRLATDDDPVVEPAVQWLAAELARQG